MHSLHDILHTYISKLVDIHESSSKLNRLFFGIWNHVLRLLWTYSWRNLQKNRWKTIHYLISSFHNVPCLVILWTIHYFWSSSNSRIDVRWYDANWSLLGPYLSSNHSRNHKIHLRSFKNWRIAFSLWQSLSYLNYNSKFRFYLRSYRWRYLVRSLWVLRYDRHFDDCSLHSVLNLLFFGYPSHHL